MRTWQYLYPRGAVAVASVPTTVTVSPASASFPVSTGESFTASVLDQFGQPIQNPTVSWASSNTSVATVTSVGFVTGIGTGSCTITATAGSASGTSAVTITAAPVATTITVTPSTASVAVGATVALVAVVKDQYGNAMGSEIISWTSSNASDATVSSTGVVTGVAAGSVTITAFDLNTPTVSATCAVTVTATSSLAFNQTAYPHSSTGVLFDYTDFRTSYLTSSTQQATEQAFIATHADKVLSGGEPAGGYPTGLIHTPYTLTSWQEVCVSDVGGTWDAVLDRTDKDFTRYCTANGLNVEDGYLHYASGQAGYLAAISTISATGVVTLTYDLTTYAQAFQNGDVVTIAGNAVAANNGTFTISGVSTTGGVKDANGDLVNAQTTFTIPASGTTGGGGTATRPGDGTSTKHNRFIFDITGFPPPRWSIHHGHTTRIAYEKSRLTTLLAGSDTSYVPKGAYVDEVASNNFSKVLGAGSLEFAANSTTFITDIAALYNALHAAHPTLPWVQQVGTASYTNTNTVTIIDTGSQSTQLENLLLTRTAYTNWVVGGGMYNWVRARLTAGDYCEINTPYVPTDVISGGGGNYASDPVPPGCNSSANVRMIVGAFTVVLTLYDPVAWPKQLSFSAWNGGWNPSNVNDGLNGFWVAAVEAPLGTPTAAAIQQINGTATDPLGQKVFISTRAFAGGLVVYRADQAWSGTIYDDTAAYSYTPPASGGVGGQWRRTKSDGTLDVAASAFSLRPDEGLILQPA